MKKLSLYIFAGLFAAMVGGSVVNTAAPSVVQAKCGSFLTFPTWYDGLTTGSDCKLAGPKKTEDGLSNYIWHIALNIIEIVLQLVAYASAGFIIYGGFKYMTSIGFPDKSVAARKTITNAVVGLVISFFAVIIVSVVTSRL